MIFFLTGDKLGCIPSIYYYLEQQYCIIKKENNETDY